MAISKIQRRNKTEVKHIDPKYAIPTRDKIIKFITESKDGLTFREIYEKMPNMSPRNIREHIQKLKNTKRLRMETCRCHSSTVYYVK